MIKALNYFLILLVVLCAAPLVAKNMSPKLPDLDKGVVVERDFSRDKAATIGATIGSMCTLNAIIDGAGESSEVTLSRMIGCYKGNFARFGYNFEPEIYNETLGLLYIK